jgi:hypothetical protein
MAKRKLYENIQREPSRFYRVPGDVLRDRRFDTSERAGILRAWQGLDDRADIAMALSELEMKEGAP